MALRKQQDQPQPQGSPGHEIDWARWDKEETWQELRAMIKQFREEDQIAPSDDEEWRELVNILDEDRKRSGQRLLFPEDE